MAAAPDHPGRPRFRLSDQTRQPFDPVCRKWRYDHDEGGAVRPSKAERDTSFAVFMDQAGPALLRTAWFLTGDADRAQELTQAAFVKTYVVWHKIDQDRALAYARRCLVNYKIDVWRTTRHEVVADVAGPGFEPGPASR